MNDSMHWRGRAARTSPQGRPANRLAVLGQLLETAFRHRGSPGLHGGPLMLGELCRFTRSNAGIPIEGVVKWPPARGRLLCAGKWLRGISTDTSTSCRNDVFSVASPSDTSAARSLHTRSVTMRRAGSSWKPPHCVSVATEEPALTLHETAAPAPAVEPGACSSAFCRMSR